MITSELFRLIFFGLGVHKTNSDFISSSNTDDRPKLNIKGLTNRFKRIYQFFAFIDTNNDFIAKLLVVHSRCINRPLYIKIYHTVLSPVECSLKLKIQKS